MSLTRFLIPSLLFLLPLHFHILEANMNNRENSTLVPSSPSLGSPWLRMTVNNPNEKTGKNPREPGCKNRPWICRKSEYPPWERRFCCKNRCVDVSSDVNNCGACNIRCPFGWQCCRGQCVNTNFNPRHCGSCQHRCPIGRRCIYGMCGYSSSISSIPTIKKYVPQHSSSR
ncbi:stigma-specific STIG1-like protein 2 [Impatiens glandulifera]|uniref:stigma-specific STIG1-like protein 2 n=1 Tax=Impatiens glandulifera TaxID=253017 RepID=UPI001FB18925|nr:stigma-specific STIG1-like protein 2 [Impatiens glandulifera]